MRTKLFIKHMPKLKEKKYHGYTIKFIRLLSILKGYNFIEQRMAIVKGSTGRTILKSKITNTKEQAYENIKKVIGKRKRR